MLSYSCYLGKKSGVVSISEKKFQEIIAPLPRKHREKLNRSMLNVTDLEQWAQDSTDAMKRDLWVGIPWFVMYSSSLFVFGFQNSTITLLVIGVIYFMYSYFKFGSFGLNRVRRNVYEALLEELRK